MQGGGILPPRDQGGVSLVPPTPAPSTSALLQKQDRKDLELASDVQQLVVIKEEAPREWIPSPDQKDPEPNRIKEEKQELWIDPEGDEVHGEEAGISSLPLTVITVKCDDNEEKPPSSQLHQIRDTREAGPPPSSSAEQMKTETDGENSGPYPDSSETEVSDDDYWQDPLSDCGSENGDAKKSGVHYDVGCNSCSRCGGQFVKKMWRHMSQWGTV
ncbi:uncharacterized protein LOC133419779 [Cololabis saira]|uniref:uncharacterized protein LOC133419779 n=1 Tax=Cololabis saira TaxID=129043 RepID=UPI002AD5573E|nr:uncharacterized protein LOC133419779 [Cololabis saira]